MKKDIFNGKIKPEFVSYIFTSIVIVSAIFMGCGAFFVFMVVGPIADNASDVRILLLVMGMICLLLALLYPFLTVIAIKKYPKYKRLRKCVLNSDYYFVGEDNRTYHGSTRGKIAFEAVIQTADENKCSNRLKRPMRYWIYIGAIIVGIILLFGNIFITYRLLDGKDIPEFIQRDWSIFTAFVVAEVVITILLFVFAILAKKSQKRNHDSDFQIKNDRDQ